MSIAEGAAPSAGGLPGTRGGSSTMLQFIFFMEDVDALMARANKAISGPSLAVFLREEGQRFFHDDIETRFYDEGDLKTGFWAPLKDATIHIREAMGFGAEPINRRTDEMFNFLMEDYPVEWGEGFAQMTVPGKPTGEVAKKIKTAQVGSNQNPWGYGPTPPRPVLAVSEMDAQTLMELYQVFFIAEMMGGAI